MSAYTGPNSGLTQLTLDTEMTRPTSTVAGVTNWDNPSDFAYGLSLSLYEEDRTRKRAVDLVNRPEVQHEQPFIFGEPIADVFGVVVRENNTILAVADGSGWGRKPRLAARCAVNSSISYITENFDKFTFKRSANSATLSKILYESMHAAQQCIMEHGATLTTLSIAVACKIKSDKSDEWGLFVASVGDSPVCIYCPHLQEIFDVTVGCHSKDGLRKVQESGGALGPAIGILPDLDNLSLSYSPVYPGDIVLLMTDGVMDNFSPQVMRNAQEERKHEMHSSDTDSGIVINSPDQSPDISASSKFNHVKLKLPLAAAGTQQCSSYPRSSPHFDDIPWSWGSPASTDSSPTDSPLLPRSIIHKEREHITNDIQVVDLMSCCENVSEVGQFLRHHQREVLFDNISAHTVSSAMINLVVANTESKRRFRADCIEKGIDVSRRKRSDSEFAKQVEHHCSKLDHATIVSYCVGVH